MLLPRLLVSWLLVFFLSTRFATAEQIGPSFDCHSARQPLAQMLCTDPDLSRTDLRFARAYFALLRQVGDAGKRELKQEDLQFLEVVQRQCGIPLSGQIAPQSQSTRNCVKNAYEAQRAVWVLRLTPLFSEEANRPIERHVALQRLLQRLGFLPADAVIDGVYGPGTREAISKWQGSQNRTLTGVLGDMDVQALEQDAKIPNHDLPRANATSSGESATQNLANSKLNCMGFAQTYDLGGVRGGLVDTGKTEREIKSPSDQSACGDQFREGRDYGTALAWYRRAAEQGYAPSQRWLGSFYQNGWGVQQDYTQALVWYRKAAEQGDVAAENAVGLFSKKS
jgi:hypothetical protein